MATIRSTEEMAEALLDAAGLANDENAEWWRLLAALTPAYRDAASEAFADAIEAEIESEYDRLINDFTIVVGTITEPRTVRRLVHSSELPDQP